MTRNFCCIARPGLQSQSAPGGPVIFCLWLELWSNRPCGHPCRRNRAKNGKKAAVLLENSGFFEIEHQSGYVRACRRRPSGRAARVRRTSVLGLWPKTLAQSEFISPEQLRSPKGGAGLRPAEPKKKDTTCVVSFFLVDDTGLEPVTSRTSTPKFNFL